MIAAWRRMKNISKISIKRSRKKKTHQRNGIVCARRQNKSSDNAKA